MGYEWLVKEWIEPVVLPGSHMRLPMCIRYLGSVQAKHIHIQIIYLHAMVRYIYIRTHEIRESCIEMTFATLHSETVLLATFFFAALGSGHKRFRYDGRTHGRICSFVTCRRHVRPKQVSTRTGILLIQ